MQAGECPGSVLGRGASRQTLQGWWLSRSEGQVLRTLATHGETRAPGWACLEEAEGIPEGADQTVAISLQI